MRKPTFSELRNSYASKGYKFYDTGKYNLNIFGIRANNSQSDQFDDYVGVAFYDGKTNPKFFVFNATTDPGKYWLMNPFSSSGTAIVALGQHKSVYALGIHGRSGKFPYEALEQVNPIPFVRDNNRDSKLDFELYRDPELRKKHLITNQIIKTNIHRASKWKLLRFIERYSAGCQVIQNPSDFDVFIRIVKLAVHTYKWRNLFSYTLFEENEIQWK